MSPESVKKLHDKDKFECLYVELGASGRSELHYYPLDKDGKPIGAQPVLIYEIQTEEELEAYHQQTLRHIEDYGNFVIEKLKVA